MTLTAVLCLSALKHKSKKLHEHVWCQVEIWFDRFFFLLACEFCIHVDGDAFTGAKYNSLCTCLDHCLGALEKGLLDKFAHRFFQEILQCAYM